MLEENHNYNNNEIILQAFDWNTAINYEGVWYQNLKELVTKIKDAGFTAVWLPPPWRETLPGWKETNKNNVGYFWIDFNKNSAYGTDEQLRQLAKVLTENGIRVIYDLVINHRDTFHSSKEEGVEQPWCEIPLEQQRANGPNKKKPAHLEQFNYETDLDLSGPVLNAFVDELSNLIKNYHAQGFRFDFAKGYSPEVVKELIDKVREKTPNMPPLFLVAEHWSTDDKDVAMIPENMRAQNLLVHWSEKSVCNMYDFPLQHEFFMKNNNNMGLQKSLNANPNKQWRERAVTFVDNHDTGFSETRENKTYRDYNVRKPIDYIFRKSNLAYIMLTPGTPCVFWPHWETWGKHDGTQQLINDLIQIRKRSGIRADSEIHFNWNVHYEGTFVTVKGSNNNEVTLCMGMGIENRFNEFKEGITYYAKDCGFIHFNNTSAAKKIMEGLGSFSIYQQYDKAPAPCAPLLRTSSSCFFSSRAINASTNSISHYTQETVPAVCPSQ